MTELPTESLYGAVSVRFLDDDGDPSLRRPLRDHAGTDAYAVKGLEDTCVDPRAPEHIPPLEVDECLLGQGG